VNRERERERIETTFYPPLYEYFFVVGSQSHVCQNKCKIAPYRPHIWFILLHQIFCAMFVSQFWGALILQHLNIAILQKLCLLRLSDFVSRNHAHFRGVDVFVTINFNSHYSNKGCLVTVVDLTVKEWKHLQRE